MSDTAEPMDEDNPAWTKDDFARARRLKPGVAELEAFPKVAARLGRPKSGARKIEIKLRVDPPVLEAWRASGPGWQTRMRQVLAERAPKPR